MKKYLALYSRTGSVDYRWIAAPDKIVCPEDILMVLKNKAENLLQDGVYYDDNDDPIWLLIKEQEYILWGFATLNQKLSKRYCFDNSKTRIRCFCGFIAIPEESENNMIDSLPYSTDAFVPIFEDVMSKMWDGLNSTIRNVLFVINDADFGSIKRSPTERVNLDNHICRFFPDALDKEKLVGECLSSRENISIAINVKMESQVYNEKPLSLLNAVMHSSDYIQNDQIIKSKCSICNKWFDSLVDGKCEECIQRETEESRNGNRDESFPEQETLDMDDRENGKKRLKKRKDIFRYFIIMSSLIIIGLCVHECQQSNLFKAFPFFDNVIDICIEKMSEILFRN